MGGDLTDKPDYEKWMTVKKMLEKSGKTASPFYERAVTILRTGVDPGPTKF